MCLLSDKEGTELVTAVCPGIHRAQDPKGSPEAIPAHTEMEAGNNSYSLPSCIFHMCHCVNSPWPRAWNLPPSSFPILPVGQTLMWYLTRVLPHHQAKGETKAHRYLRDQMVGQAPGPGRRAYAETCLRLMQPDTEKTVVTVRDDGNHKGTCPLVTGDRESGLGLRPE